jgi:Zn-dependent protease with chaperone function
VVCPWCGRVADPNRRFCCGHLLIGDAPNNNQLAADAPRIPLPSEYALPTDLALAKAAGQIPILPTLAGAVISRWQKPVERAKLLGDGIRITARQSPNLYSVLQLLADRIGVKCPEMFIKQDPTLNAYTLGTNEDHVLVIHSGLFDAAQPDELQFILGHELGHIRNHHVKNMTIARLLTQGLIQVAGILVAPLVVPLDAWSREAEKTADRAGFLATLSPEASVRALVLLAAGSRKLMSEFNLAEYLSQREGLNTAQGKIDLWLGGYDHPHLVERVKALAEFIVSPMGRAALSQRSRFQSQQPGLLQKDVTESGPGLEQQLTFGSSHSHFCTTCGFELPESATVCIICSTVLH